MRKIFSIGIMVMMVLMTFALIGGNVTAGTTHVIDFEEFRAVSLGGLGGNIEILNYYAGLGVHFSGPTSLIW